MSGDLVIRRQDDPFAKHTRMMLSFCDGFQLLFVDTRKFGRIWLVNDPQEILHSLGPEPLSDSFTAADLFQKIQKHRRQIKPLLLDQSFLAGLGNIYTDEALHYSKIHPLTLSHLIEKRKAFELWNAIREVLKLGIENNGASIDWVFRGGKFQNQIRVYNRKDEPCHECGAIIQKIVVGQRGTYFCPVCQPTPI
jgi:formamidopyrimidine-DNA glycosylase